MSNGISNVGDLPQSDALHALADATDDLVLLVTADWEHAVFADGTYREVLGRPVAELEDDPTAFVESVHPADRDDLRALMRAVGDGQSGELEVRLDGEKNRWLQIRARPITEAQSVTHVAGVFREITERKRHERELERVEADLESAKEELQQFAYVVSHDLQEPLRMVSSYMDLLESEYADELDEEATEYIEFAADGAERMKALIDGLLKFSRVETRGNEKKPVETTAALDDAKQALAVTIDETSATIEAESLPTVPADRDQLSEVFQTLLSNAIQYAGDDSPTVEIRADERDDEVVFAVEDDGIGIPEDDQEDVFGIFERGTNATGDGIGIGLAIARRIVERHDGEMWVESEPGQGTTVYFSLSRDQGQ